MVAALTLALRAPFIVVLLLAGRPARWCTSSPADPARRATRPAGAAHDARVQPTRERVPAPVLPACAGLGLVAGALAKAADESGSGWAADLGSFPAAWVLAVALLGRAAPTVRAAAARSAVFFAVMSVAYYAWAALVLGFGWNRLLVAWLLLSVTAVPAVAAAVQWATRRPGPLPGALLAGAAGIVLAGGAVLADARAHPVQAVADVVVAAVLVTVLPRHGRTRLWAPALLLPATWLAGRGLAVLAALLG